MLQARQHNEEPHRICFYEPFNSEQETRLKGGTPTNVTYSNGVVNIDRDNSGLLHYNLSINVIGTFRIKLRVNEWQITANDPYIYDWRIRGPGNVYCSINDNGDQKVYTVGGGILYVNGIVSQPALELDTWYEIIISGVPINYNGIYSVGSWSGDLNQSRPDWDIDFIEIYNYAMTASEIANLL